MATRTDFVNAMIDAFNNHGVYIGTANGELTEKLTIEDIKKKEIAYGYDRETTLQNIRRDLAYIGKCYDLGYNMEKSLAGDCSGMIYGILKGLGVLTSDLRARDFQKQSKPISLKELIPGDFVFDKTEEAGHIGVYIGKINGLDYVLDCRGRDVGLVKKPLTDYKWKAAGRAPWFDEDKPVFTREIKYIPGDMMCGDDVRAVQQQLTKKGYYPGAIDGIYGEKSETAVIDFQFDTELNIKRLGVVGRKTWGALFS